MGSLKPGVTYIYERVGSTVYAREFGETDRKVIGYDLNKGTVNDFALWNDMIAESERSPALQKALENAIMIYRLSKDNPL